ncbi:MAG: isoprenyl transferase [Phycisphaerales bacterium JB039]
MPTDAPTSPHGPRRVVAADPQIAAAVAAIQARNPKADPLTELPDVDPRRLPRHIAIIMDGNGRWAEQRGFPRIVGHRNGAATVRQVIECAGRLGIEALTLYSFSMENWKRPSEEVQALMALCVMYLEGEREEMVREGVRFRVIGRRAGLPPEVVAGIESVERATAHCTRATLCLALNYGARAEIVDAARALARRVRDGDLAPDDIDETAFSGALYTAGLPDPDLLIRTAGEMRISNYLLWQISYAELHVTDVLWPDFGDADLHAAIRDFASRKRRFGGLNAPESQ